MRDREHEQLLICYFRICVMAVVGIEMVRERRWRATVPVVLQYRGNCSQEEGCQGERAAARVGGRWFRPRPAREKGFPSNLLLD